MASQKASPKRGDGKQGGTVKATVTAAGMRVVKLLVGNPPKTVAELIDTTGVTRTAVTEQLNELTAAGFVERTVERLPGRGRPRHLYGATPAALLLLFADTQRMVVPAIWQALNDVGGIDLTCAVLARLAATLADHYRSRIKSTTPQKRLREMIEILREEGGLLEIDEDDAGSLVLRKRSCPFISMYEASGNVCSVDQQMMSLIVGSPVVRTACRHHGASCCTFEIAPSNGKG